MDGNQIFTLAQEYNAQGKTLYTANKYAEALEYYKKAEAEDPMLREVYLNMGEALIMLDKYEEAKNAYEKMLLLDKKDGEAMFHLGNVAFLMENNELGREMYARAVNSGYDDAQMYLNLGYMHYEKEDFPQAVIEFTKALARDKFLPMAYMNKAKAQYQLGLVNESVQTLDHMIQYLPEVFEGHHYKILFLMKENRFKEAKTALDKAIAMFPGDIAFHFDYLLMLESETRVQEALAYYEEHFAGAERPLYRIEKAKLLIASEDRKAEGMALLEELSACEDAQIAAQATFFLVIQYMAKEETQKALDCAEKLIQMDAKDSHYYTALYYKGKLLKKLGDDYHAKKALEAAVVELRMATSRDPGTMDYYLLRGMCLKDLDKLDKAFEMANYMLSLSPNMPEALFLRAQLYKAMRQDENAQKDLDAARATASSVSQLLKLMDENGGNA